MSIIAKVPSNSYKIPNEGSHTGTLTNVEDKGWQPNPFQKDKDGQPRLRHQVLLQWQLEDEFVHRATNRHTRVTPQPVASPSRAEGNRSPPWVGAW